jgi:hypothetical protein
MKKLYIQLGVVAAVVLLLFVSNPNEKEDLSRYVGNSRGRWLTHHSTNYYLFSVHELTTGKLLGLQVNGARYLGVCGMFFRISNEEASLLG